MGKYQTKKYTRYKCKLWLAVGVLILNVAIQCSNQIIYVKHINGLKYIKLTIPMLTLHYTRSMQNLGTDAQKILLLVKVQGEHDCMVNRVNSSSPKGHSSANQPKLKQYEHT